jgi:hypothetical protein
MVKGYKLSKTDLTNQVMKYYFLLFCCLIASTAWSQDSSMLASWNKLTSAFVNRSVIFENITLSASKIIKIDSSTVKSITEGKVALKNLVHFSIFPDSNFIQQAVEENKKSIAAFSKILRMLSDPAFTSKKEAKDFQMQLMAVENHIFSAKKEYNSLMLAKNRKDLLYP